MTAKRDTTQTDCIRAWKVVEYCTEDGCRCDDRSGVILYQGTSLDEALESVRQARYDHVEINRI